MNEKKFSDAYFCNSRIIVGAIAGDAATAGYAKLEQSKGGCLLVKLIRPDYLKVNKLIQVG